MDITSANWPYTNLLLIVTNCDFSMINYIQYFYSTVITYNVHVKLMFHNFFSILVHSTLILYFLPWQIKNFLTTLFKQWLTLLSTMYPNKMQPMILHSHMVTKVKVFRKLHVFIGGFFFVCHQCSRHFRNSIHASSKGHNGLQIRYTVSRIIIIFFFCIYITW